jgi:hypothetical protein
LLKDLQMATWDDVVRIARELPETNEATSYGNRSWAVNKKSFAWERPLRKADLEALGAGAPAGPILGVRTPDLELKEALIASDPRVFFTTPHFDGYAAVLIVLSAIRVPALRDVMREAWLARAPKRLAEQYLAERKKPASRRSSREGEEAPP